MIFATLNNDTPDGELLVVNKARSRAVRAGSIAPTLQSALDRWDAVMPVLRELSDKLERNEVSDDFEIDLSALMAPLPRSYAYFDAGCYPHHLIPIRAARGAKIPEDFYEKPLMYEGCSAPIAGPKEPLRLLKDDEWGVDIEAEVAAVLGDVPAGVKREDAARYIRLLVLYNDTSLRQLTAPELGRGFGFLQSKPMSSMGPFAITPDEAGELWNGEFLGGRYLLHVRGEVIGDLDPGKDNIFTWPDLIVHAAKTRPLIAGTLMAAGTLGNEDRRHGCGCLAELRSREQLTEGSARTPFLKFGDSFRLELLDRDGQSVFGAIDQRLEQLPEPKHEHA
ncbi:fumarylacetoacetate hydrolase family protein [Hydrogenophaga sp. YM1]|uniref:fumarylacetoacetate hydrolase family protein n=1 Tax=Hydrogenophaga sp. YM1 TaxID=2806262 RepID=UPI00195CD3E3|nr:fumarylacetoacetate hydrolase family protein [Hydrogenophaga sp. YM1]QRR34011.1 fumarylacetoacetate hydrolase family protein [Hydrogenophaga sp. YM1]